MMRTKRNAKQISIVSIVRSCSIGIMQRQTVSHRVRNQCGYIGSQSSSYHASRDKNERQRAITIMIVSEFINLMLRTDTN